MKKVRRILSWNAVLAGMASPAIAAAKGVDESSHIVIWAFLSFCALIIVSQLMPVLSDLIEARKMAQKEAQESTAIAEKRDDSQTRQRSDERWKLP